MINIFLVSFYIFFEYFSAKPFQLESRHGRAMLFCVIRRNFIHREDITLAARELKVDVWHY